MLQLLGNHPGLTHNRAINGVEVTDRIHIIQRQHHFAIRRYRPATEAGAATAGHNTELQIISAANHRLNLFNRARKDDSYRRRIDRTGPITAISGEILFGDPDIGLTNDLV